jgi:hypothetical protein
MRKLSYYDPETYPQGVPNPYGARVHAWNPTWKGGPPEYGGTRYHGGVWTRPDYELPFERRPLWGLGQTTGIKAGTAWVIGVGMLGVGFVAGYIVGQLMLADDMQERGRAPEW